MKKIIVNSTVHTTTELFKKKWAGDCEKTTLRDFLESSIDIICDDEDECKVIKAFLSSKGYEKFHVSILEITDPKEYTIHIDEGKDNGKILNLIRKTFKFVNVNE